MPRFATASSRSEVDARRQIVRQFNLWNDWERSEIVGDYDFPPPREVGTLTATVRFKLRGTTVTIACQTQPSYRQNLICCMFAIESMRKNEKRGIDDTIRKAYLQLEAPATQRDPYEVLGVRPDEQLDFIEDVYKLKAKRAHPDAGGSNTAMQELNDALERIRAEHGSPAAPGEVP